MQTDVILLQAERRLIARATGIMVLVYNSNFRAATGQVVCELKTISTIITENDKAVNDNHAHAAGDEAMRYFTERLQASLGQSIDWVARFGGEEFVLVLPEASLEAAAREKCAYLPLPRVCLNARTACRVRPTRLFIAASSQNGTA
jgi:predicted signal transduction protein with EAL and GGDEF domain